MIKVCVPISGGKDSQACLKLALTKYPKEEILGLFCDTQFEHPITYHHIDKLRSLYGVHIETITAGSVPDMIRKYKRFPNGAQRFCTEELKIWPSKRYYRALAERQGGFEVWYGMRWEESHERAKRYAGKVGDEVYPPHEFMRKYPKLLHKLGVSFRLPILDWSKQDVLDYLEGEENPLYSEGFDRVGCFPCMASGNSNKEKAYRHDEFGAAQLIVVQNLEAETGRSSWGGKRGKIAEAAGPGCALCSI